MLSSACFARILVAATVILFPLRDYSKKRAGWGQQEIPWSWGAKKGETHLEPSLSVLDETFLELELPPQLLALPRYLIHSAYGGESIRESRPGAHFFASPNHCFRTLCGGGGALTALSLLQDPSARVRAPLGAAPPP
jgi:hypothetical protein